TITYKLGADGQAESMTTAGITTKIEFDEYQRRMSLDDPSLGLIKYSYDESGNLAKMINANGDSILYTTISGTDKLSAKSSKEKTTEYEYNDYMQLTKSVTDNGAECLYTYDDYGRLVSEIEQFADKWLRKDYSYSDGNIASITYTTHSGMTATEVYKYANGHLIGIDIENVFGNTSGTIIFSGDRSKSSGTLSGFVLSEENELGLTTKSSSGNIGYTLKYSECGIPVGRTARSSQMQLASFIGGGSLKPLSTDDIGIFWPKDTIIGGWLDTIPAVLPDRPIEPLTMTLYDIEYEYDGLTGNLLCKWEPEYDIGSYYYYDRLNRLVGSQYMYTNYDKKGNIISHSDYGDFSYDLPDKPYAVSGTSLYDPDASLPVQQIGYTSFARPAVITEGNSRSVFTYNGEDERVRMELYADDKKTLTRYYLGNCYELDETENGVVERLYLTGNYYSAGVVLVCKDGKQSPYSIARDELGSVTHVVNLDNKIFQDVRYDAWGRLCDPESLSLYTSDDMPELFLGRGYTGHEHLSQFGLINMNARLYDPMLGRFLSPDPYVQMPDFTQSFNRYAYCMNNPMIYKDENGEFFFTIFTVLYDIGRNMFKHGFKFSHYDMNRTVNAWKIDLGMFQGNIFQIENKWTWGLPNSVVGNIIAHFCNIIGLIDNVTEMDGMLALAGPQGSKTSAFTIGHYSFGPENYTADWRDHLFV
ncbi:MAG: hypothetical protein K2M65_07685, partial [Muribaculaceae bacterium]|nr:hypothetical protein [Muribaculaceae bacterium]